MGYKTIPNVDDGFGDRTPACREHTLPRSNSDSRIYAAIPGQILMGPVLQVHIIRYLGINEIEIRIPSTTTKERTLWVVICRKKNSNVDELPLNDPGHNPTSSGLLLERLVAKESEPCSTEMEQSSIEETRAKQLKIQTNPVNNHSEDIIPIEERKWNDISAYDHFKGNTLETEVSKLVMRLVRRYDRDERNGRCCSVEIDVSKNATSVSENWRTNSRTFDWLQHIYEASNKTRFQYCKNSQDVRPVVYSRYSRTHWWERDCA